MYLLYVLSSHRGRKRASDPLELELQVIVSYPMRMLRIELRSSARIEMFPITVSLAPDLHYFGYNLGAHYGLEHLPVKETLFLSFPQCNVLLLG